MMKKRKRIVSCVLAALLLTGCRFNGDNAENEALRQQIRDLENQVAALQQAQTDTGEATGNVGEKMQENTETSTPAPTETTTANSSQEQGGSSGQNGSGETAITTDTIENLTALVDGYVTDIDTLTSGDGGSDLDSFFTEKQRAEEINRALDRHEDELERAVNTGILSREDYLSRERELEKLEDSLDSAEDSLEFFFGMDD